MPDGEDGLGELLIEPLALEPPAAESFFVSSLDEEALEDEDGVLGVVGLPDMEPEVEPAAEPEGELGVVRETARSPASLSQPVISPAPSARETATAKVESLICGPPWLG